MEYRKALIRRDKKALAVRDLEKLIFDKKLKKKKNNKNLLKTD